MPPSADSTDEIYPELSLSCAPFSAGEKQAGSSLTVRPTVKKRRRGRKSEKGRAGGREEKGQKEQKGGRRKKSRNSRPHRAEAAGKVTLSCSAQPVSFLGDSQFAGDPAPSSSPCQCPRAAGCNSLTIS